MSASLTESAKVSRTWRLLSRDGSFNIEGRGRGFDSKDVYHSLLAVSWPKFIALQIGLYFFVNFVFAALYLACGEGALAGALGVTLLDRYTDAFFFSVQTLATIGYGKITPEGIPANILVTLEAIIGLFGLALASGLMFSRFSRPTARVVFARKAIIVPHDGVQSFCFRIANERLNQIVEAKIKVVLIRNIVTTEGQRYRDLFDLKLDRDESPMFALSWMVVHAIT